MSQPVVDLYRARVLSSESWTTIIIVKCYYFFQIFLPYAVYAAFKVRGKTTDKYWERRKYIWTATAAWDSLTVCICIPNNHPDFTDIWLHYISRLSKFKFLPLWSSAYHRPPRLVSKPPGVFFFFFFSIFVVLFVIRKKESSYLPPGSTYIEFIYYPFAQETKIISQYHSTTTFSFSL